MTEPLHLTAYYYTFDPTGVKEVDDILAAVASAGKAHHSTENWGPGVIDPIQAAADRAAAALRTARAS